MTTYLLCLGNVCFNKQSLFLWKSTVFFFWSISTFICMKLQNHGFLLAMLSSDQFKSCTVANIIWLTLTEYLFDKWPLMCSICRSHVSVQCTFIINYCVCDKSNRMGATIGSWISYPTISNSLLPDISGVCVAQNSVFWVLFCRSLFPLYFGPLHGISFFNLRIFTLHGLIEKEKEGICEKLSCLCARYRL